MPVAADTGLSALRAQYAGPTGAKGLVATGKTTAIATFAALGGFVYGCMLLTIALSLPATWLTL